jgi:hypothetical protein
MRRNPNAETIAFCASVLLNNASIGDDDPKIREHSPRTVQQEHDIFAFHKPQDIIICLGQTRLKIRGNGEEISTIVLQDREVIAQSLGANRVTRSDD